MGKPQYRPLTSLELGHTICIGELYTIGSGWGRGVSGMLLGLRDWTSEHENCVIMQMELSITNCPSWGSWHTHKIISLDSPESIHPMMEMYIWIWAQARPWRTSGFRIKWSRPPLSPLLSHYILLIIPKDHNGDLYKSASYKSKDF